MNHLDLFSGIGGFSLGARLAGITWTSHHYSEIEPNAIKIFKKHFPEAIAQGDITSIDGHKLRDKYGPDWCITGGFPCQDLSAAGSQRGLSGSRSGLWFQMLRLIREIQPKVVIIENVPQLLTHGYELVLCPLAELGMDVEWAVVPASALGACHVRRRVWVVAYTNSDGWRESITNSQYQEGASDRFLGNGGNIDSTNQGLLSWTEWEAIRTAREVCSEPLIARIDDGVSTWLDRVRALGNAVVPQIPAAIFRRLVLKRIVA